MPKNPVCGSCQSRTKRSNTGWKAGPLKIAGLTSLQDQARNHRYREVQLLAIIPAAAPDIGPAQILQIGNHTRRVVDLLEKGRFDPPRPFPGEKLVGRPVELEEPYVGARRKTALAILGQPVRWIGAFERRL